MDSLSGADPCQKVTQGYKGRLSTDGNRTVSTKAKAGLTASVTAQAGSKDGLSDPPMPIGRHGA